MKIIINGKDAVLKKGTSFEFVDENRSFTGSDSYTLSITFPLRGCPENFAIFGYWKRRVGLTPSGTRELTPRAK